MLKITLAASFVATTYAACDIAAVTKCAADYPAPTDPEDKTAACQYLKDVMDCSDAAGCLDEATKAASQKAYDDAGCGGCFPATAEVTMADNSVKQMGLLVEGDKVSVGSGAVSEVYMFSTQLESTTSKFTEITCGSRKPLLLTHTHYLYINGKLAQAGSAKVGDELTLANGKTAAITAVGEQWAPGLYNPHTQNGDIIVDGFLTSTYTGAVHPTLAHALLYPVRQMYQFGSSFGAQFSVAGKGVPDWIRKAISAN